MLVSVPGPLLSGPTRRALTSVPHKSWVAAGARPITAQEASSRSLPILTAIQGLHPPCWRSGPRTLCCFPAQPLNASAPLQLRHLCFQKLLKTRPTSFPPRARTPRPGPSLVLTPAPALTPSTFNDPPALPPCYPGMSPTWLTHKFTSGICSWFARHYPSGSQGRAGPLRSAR